MARNRSLLLIALFIPAYLHAQEAEKVVSLAKNNINAYVGLFDANVNYERLVFEFRRSYSKLRIGGGYWTDWQSDGDYINANFVHLTGKKRVHFEANAGIRLIIEGSDIESDDPKTFVYPDLFLGLRLEKPTGGFTFRTGLAFPSIVNIGVGLNF